jgi:hypothetical protein
MIDDDERASVAITVANPAAPRSTGVPAEPGTIMLAPP